MVKKCSGFNSYDAFIRLILFNDDNEKKNQAKEYNGVMS